MFFTTRLSLLLSIGVFLGGVSSSLIAHENTFGGEHEEWSFTGEYDGIVYLVDHDDLLIERYDMHQAAWLEPLIPPAQPSAFTVDSHGIVIATDRSLYSVITGTTDFQFIGNSVNSVLSLIHISEPTRPY